MSLSDDIKNIIYDTLPSSVHCGECDRDCDRLASDILQAVADEILK